MAGFGKIWNGTVLLFKVLCIFVMVWCCIFATFLSRRTLNAIYFPNLRWTLRSYFFARKLMKNVAEKFCVISEIWTELCRKTLCWKYIAENQTLRDRSSLRDNGKPKTKLCSKMLRCLLSSENIKLHLTAV